MRPKKIVLIFICSALFLYFLHVLKDWRSTQAADFYQFWLVGQAISTMDVTDVYSEAERLTLCKNFIDVAKTSNSRHFIYCARNRPILELAGTPFLYEVFFFLSSGDFDQDYNRFRIISFISYFAGIVLLCVLFKFPPELIFVTVIFFTRFFWPFRLEWLSGNVNEIQMAGLALYLWIQKKFDWRWNYLYSGALLGFLIFFKPNLVYVPLLLGFWWLITQQTSKIYQSFVGFLLAALIGFISPILLFGESCGWKNWYFSFQEIVFKSWNFKKSFLGVFFGINNYQTFQYFSIALIISTVLIMIYFKSRLSGSIDNKAKTTDHTKLWEEDNLIMALGVLVYLISAPLVHGHYFLLIIPIALFLLRPRPFGKSFTLVQALTSVAIALIATNPILRESGLNFLHYHNKSYNFVGILILYGLTLLELKKSVKIELH